MLITLRRGCGEGGGAVGEGERGLTNKPVISHCVSPRRLSSSETQNVKKVLTLIEKNHSGKLGKEGASAQFLPLVRALL